MRLHRRRREYRDKFLKNYVAMEKERKWYKVQVRTLKEPLQGYIWVWNEDDQTYYMRKSKC